MWTVTTVFVHDCFSFSVSIELKEKKGRSVPLIVREETKLSQIKFLADNFKKIPFDLVSEQAGSRTRLYKAEHSEDINMYHQCNSHIDCQEFSFIQQQITTTTRGECRAAP